MSRLLLPEHAGAPEPAAGTASQARAAPAAAEQSPDPSREGRDRRAPASVPHPPAPRPLPRGGHRRGASGPAAEAAPKAAPRAARHGKPAATAAPPGRGTTAPGDALPDPHAVLPRPGSAGSPALPRSPSSAAQLTVIPHKPESHFPADGAALLYSAQHRHRSPPHHPRRGGVQGAGIFRKQSIWVLLSLERELGNPTAKTSQRSGVSTSPAARGEGPSRGSVQPGAEHPRLQLLVPSAGASPARPAPKRRPRDTAGAAKPVRWL